MRSTKRANMSTEDGVTNLEHPLKLPTAATEVAESAVAVPHFTPDEHAARGRAARAELPRSAHAEWVPLRHRPDPVALLEEHAETRLPEPLPIRYGRMLRAPSSGRTGR